MLVPFTKLIHDLPPVDCNLQLKSTIILGIKSSNSACSLKMNQKSMSLLMAK